MHPLESPPHDGESTAADAVGSPVAAVRSWTRAVAAGLDCVNDAERVELLRALEELKCAAEAAQARAAVALNASVRAAEAAAGVPADRHGRGVAGQIGLARRCSPHRARQLLGLATIAARELPHTAAAWRAGRITERRAMLIARETATLPLPVRRRIDTELAGDPDRVARLERMSDRQTAAAALRQAARLDPAAVTARRRHAAAQRRVTLRPAPDTMTWLTAVLPVADGVAVHAALTKAADAARAAGDERTRGQVMADTLVHRVTGRATASHDITINLVITDHALFGTSTEPSRILGHGSIPTDAAHDMVTTTLQLRGVNTTGSEPRVWIRRLFTDPAGQLVAMESTRRIAPAGLAEFITLRDQTCRTPWCDAPIRHIDHITPADQGGPTTADNLQGLCEACNYTKTAPGWHAQPTHDTNYHWTVETTTPTGHTHTTRPDSWPTTRPPAKRSTPTRRRSVSRRPIVRLNARPSACEYLLRARLYAPTREAAPS